MLFELEKNQYIYTPEFDHIVQINTNIDGHITVGIRGAKEDILILHPRISFFYNRLQIRGFIKNEEDGIIKEIEISLSIADR